MTFLIADDNARMRESVIRFLSRNIPNHHTFYEAAEGSKAVKLYDQHSPDWVLMDIEMEPMDGLTALKDIRVSHPGAKIIILTSYDDIRYRKKAQEAGALAYVLKTHIDELESLIFSKSN